MEERKEIGYQVEITTTARLYFYEVAEYLYDNLSLIRAEEVATSLRDSYKDMLTLTGILTFQPTSVSP